MCRVQVRAEPMTTTITGESRVQNLKRPLDGDICPLANRENLFFTNMYSTFVTNYCIYLIIYDLKISRP